MANISKEDDERDFQERLRNGGNRPGPFPYVYETQAEKIARAQDEFQSCLAWVRHAQIMDALTEKPRKKRKKRS